MNQVEALSEAQSYQDEEVTGESVEQAQKRYGEERTRRLRDDGNQQYIDVSISDKFRYFQEDIWVDPKAVKDINTMFPENSCELLIVGGGFGGLQYAVRMVQAGIRPENIRIVDSAGGFGGTWYYNRYPGLMCDVESYSYLPLLEETGYMPKHRFSYGDEILKYANLVAEKWNLAGSAVFQTKAEKLVWDEEGKVWQVELVQTRKGESPKTVNINSRFVAMVNGVLNWPKLPNIPGLLDFRGEIFHSSRWNYSLTGGSQEDPSLTKLKDKRVAIVGTGATAVQLVPQLARWSKHLYVVQRTPASVDNRDQRETDPKWFKEKVATGAGWQRERLKNFHQHFTTGKLPEEDLVDDGWSHATALTPLAGDPVGPKTAEEIPAYLQLLHTIDLKRQNRLRARVASVVKDPSDAEKLQAWYPSWCKRPCFHDEYLSTFNNQNVTLIDTDAKGIDSLTSDSIVVGGKSYPVDIIILATGFLSPFGGTPAERAKLAITGLHGVSMTEEWAQNGSATMYGIIDPNFPNLFLSGPWQAAISPNYLFGEDVLAKNAAYILTEAKRTAAGQYCAIAPTAAAAEDWGTQVLMRSATGAAMFGCTPSYFNHEGGLEKTTPEDQLKMGRSGVWGEGIESFIARLEAWRAEGNMQGIEVRT